MYQTVEVRWFCKGEMPTAILDWFTAVDEELVIEPTRTDYYLRPFHDGIGIKLREGRIEVKQRIKVMQTIQLGEQLNGVVEHWQKWSFLLSEQNEFSEILKAAEWIAVKKTRRLHAYRSEELQQMQARFPWLPMEEDCRIELTELDVQDEKWWTLGFESKGSDETAVSTKLIPAIEWCISPTIRCLEKHDSFGYPHLLL